MMDKRNKLWRRQQMARVFKKRMMRFSAYDSYVLGDGTYRQHPHWFELAKERWAWRYKTTGSPCSCIMCSGEKYNRIAYKKETQRIIRESMM